MADTSDEGVSDVQTLSMPFELSKTQKGTVSVTVEPDNDPQNFGMDLLYKTIKPEVSNADFVGFPTCHAKVESTGAKGYASMYGWVQLVRIGQPTLSDSDEWEMDPIPITSDLNTPFTWFGPEPSLFDAPFRYLDQQVSETNGQNGGSGDMVHASSLAWDESPSSETSSMSETFLTGIGDCLITKDVQPILGIEWGFLLRDRRVTIKPLRMLDLSAWDEHLELFRAKFSGWKFHGSKE